MAAFQGILSGLRKAEGQLEQQLANVKGAIASLSGGTPRRGRPAGSKNKKGIIIVGGRRRRRRMSAAARAAISTAQKKRWAKQKAAATK